LADGNATQPPKEAAGAKAAKKDLLSESTQANKEQRKADWAIMREMAKYLWPKVMPIAFPHRCRKY
jgi:ABC transporter ATM